MAILDGGMVEEKKEEEEEEAVEILITFSPFILFVGPESD